MKKLLLFLFFAGTFTISAFSQQWVNFTNISGAEPGAPEINLTTSNAQTVTFSVTIPGIYTQDTVVNGVSFTRLILPSGYAVNPSGTPEIPVLKYKVAIPDCDGVELDYAVTSQQTMPSCWVFPVSEFVNNGDGKLIEQFAFDSAAYTQPCTPKPASFISSSGSFRDQQYVEVTFSPAEFCPLTRQLSMIDKISVTLTFTNPEGDLQQELGIFADVAASAFINYDRSATPPPLQQDPAPFVKLINLTDTAQACKIVCDYLIITDPDYYNSPHLLRLAEHRRNFNGYDIAIVNVAQILGLNFYFEEQDEHSGPYEYITEQKIRTFIRRVYEGKNARHLANKPVGVGFVLLVGDNYEGNTGMPSSREHDAETPSNGVDFPSDYYFSCVTRDKTGKYDNNGDLAIGRFSVETPQHLYNMVHKTINFETEYSPKAWRKTALFTNGGNDVGYNLTNAVMQDYLSKIKNLNLFKNGKWHYNIVNYFVNNDIKTPTLNYMNSGVAFVQYHGHGYPDSWQKLIYQSDFSQMLNNSYKTPFISTFSCSTGWFDNYESGGGNPYKLEHEECIAEFLTRYSPTKGAVGYIGATRDVSLPPPPNSNIIVYPNYFLSLLFGDSSLTLAGKLLQHAKFCDDYFIRQYKHLFTLFGDPALNIFAEGYEITRNVTADCQAKLSGTINIRNGATLIISCDFYCAENANIIVDAGGKLIINGGTLTSHGDKLWQGITVKGTAQNKGEVIITNNGKIENARIGITVNAYGKVTATDADFINNTIGVYFKPNAASSSFVKTNFELNNSYLGESGPGYYGDTRDFRIHIKAFGGVISVEGCNFSSTAPNISTNYVYNRGIDAFGADLTVKEYCLSALNCGINQQTGTCVEKCMTKTTFTGLSSAIWGGSSGTFPKIKIRYAVFNDSYNYNLFYTAANYSEIIKNKFYQSHNNSCGIRLESSTGYKIEENHFEDKSTPNLSKKTTGISIKNSGTPENEVYKNDYFNLYIAQQFLNKNSSQVDTRGLPPDNQVQNEIKITGLQTLCNKFNNNLYRDIVVGEYANIHNSIRKNQGSSREPAGNEFIGYPVINIDNALSQQNLNYYYDINKPTFYPTNVSSNVSRISTTASNGCPSKAFPGGGGDENPNDKGLAQYDEWNTEYEGWYGQLLRYEGNDEREMERLSDSVAYYSALKDNLFNSIIVAVLDEIDSITQNPNLETLRDLLAHRGQYTDYLSIIETYLRENDFNEALNTIGQMVKLFDLTEYGEDELNGLQIYIQWLQQLYNNDKNIYELTNNEIDTLVKYVETNVGRGVVFANNILCMLYNICLEEEQAPQYAPPMPPNQTEEEAEGEDDSYDHTVLRSYGLDNISLHPNPTTGELQVTSYELQINNVEIFDIYGKKLSSHRLITSSSHHKIDISHLKSGIYFVKISTEAGEVVKKVVKQ